MAIATIDPTTGKLIKEFSPLSAQEIEQRIAMAYDASQLWRRVAVAERAAVVARAGEILIAERDRFARIMTLEMGKTFKSAQDEATKCATGCVYYSDHAEAFLTDEPVEADHESSYIAFDPLGVVLAVMPWNFPFWQVIRFAAPALCAGNVGLLKHASNVPQCALALEDLFTRAGAPAGVFQTLLIGSEPVGAIIRDERIAAATVTGSEEAGSRVAAEAGAHVKKVVLELGGSDPFVVLESANVVKAAETAVRARLINNGQSCIAAKRFIAVDSVYDEFLAHFVDGFKKLRVGDPMSAETDVGPLATESIRDGLRDQLKRTLDAGATLVAGGTKEYGQGWYFEPAVVTGAPKGSPAYSEELFGPVAPVFRVADADAAIALANDSRFGLGASVWTSDEGEAHECAAALENGTVAINSLVASDARFPFGGVKASGHGRELSRFGIHEFVNIKSVRVTGFGR